MRGRNQAVEETYMEIFTKRKKEFEVNAARNKIPFCSACAYVEFKKKVDLIVKEIEITEKITLDGEDEDYAPELMELAKTFNFEQFKGHDKFEEIYVTPLRKKVEGRFTEVIEAYHVDFLCKLYKHGLTLHFFTEDYEKWRKEKSRKE